MSRYEGMRSPLSKARGLGSAKEGIQHFWVQRLTAVALVPLCLWFAFSLAMIGRADYASVHHWVAAPSVAVTLVLFVAITAYHSMLGVQVVIEDYVAGEAGKLTGIVLNKFIHIIVAAAGIFAVLKVALT